MPKFGPDEALVRKLSDLLSETGLSEIEYESEGQRIRVARGGQSVAAMTVAAAERPAEAPKVDAAGEPGTGEEILSKNAVVSPMVGTVYVAPEPGAAPFVSVGDTVVEGQTLLIIEAMKVMNPLPSPRAGKVTRVLVHDGQPVEYGEPMIIID